MMMDSSSMMMDSSSTMMMDSTSTAMAASAYSTPSYGSGNSNWGGSGYDSCVQRMFSGIFGDYDLTDSSSECMASYGSMGSYMPTATASMGSSGNGGVTHTVIVAPTQGVLRYIPFAINASVGDTVMFMWGANEHTVTKSSQLAICNKTSDAPFASGEQNKSFTCEYTFARSIGPYVDQNIPVAVTQVVNDTDPTFFYCGTPGHCEKGMFGIINPPVANESSVSVASMMPAMMQNVS
jgi:plastocyanin